MAIFALVLVVLAVFLVLKKDNQQATVPIPQAKPKLYVALGDSVAAGLGLSTPSDSSACGRTNEAYPNIIAEQKNYRVRSYACSGATIKNGVSSPQTVNKLALDSQMEQLFSGEHPALVSLTIGANDVDYLGTLQQCAVAQCGSSLDSQIIDAKLANFKKRLTSFMKTYRDHYKSEIPPIIVTGYYQLIAKDNQQKSCSDLPGFSTTEKMWALKQQSKLIIVLEDVASAYPFAHFASVSFTGHELCSNDSWIQGVNAKAPYHPTARGQQAIASSIKKEIGSL